MGSLDDRCVNLVKRYSETMEEIGHGRHRKTFDIGMGRVIKVPSWSDGIQANIHEAEWDLCSHNSVPELRIPLAKCFLVASFDKEIPLLVMQKVDRIYDLSLGWLHPMSHRDLPDWVKYIDSNQVGLDEDHNIVVYDGGDCPC